MTFKRKLILAQAPLALALVLVGGVSRLVTASLARESSLILADNYRSVLAAERMKQALELIDRALLFALVDERSDAQGSVPHRRAFERELTAQEGNITEPGEARATTELRATWTAYGRQLDRFLAAPAQRTDIYFADLAPAFARVEAAADRILAINQDAMVRKSERADRSAARAQDIITAEVLVGALLGLFATTWLTDRLLRPLGVVGAAVRRFGQGDLHARARIGGRDEIAALATEFNTMADHLERYRASSLGELLQAQQGSQAAIDALPDPVILLDAEGQLQGVNAAAAEVLAIDPETPGKAFEAVDPRVRGVIERLRTHVTGGRGPYLPKGFEEAVRVGTGVSERILLPRAAPIYGESGSVSGAAVVLQDVTRLFRFDELKNNLVATVAHEFRTPLTSLRMAIHLCLDETVGSLSEKQADLLYAARDDCERLQTIIDDVLNLSRIESGRIDLQRRRVDPQALIDLAIDVHRTAAEQARVTVLKTVAPGSPEAFADPDRVHLVFTNLLSNAIRHSPPGSEVLLGARPDGAGFLRFEVTDHGPGIPAEHQAGLFEKFFRVPGSPEGGSGLGLFIARGIVQAHGGQIGLLSTPGGGATFWFTVPVAPPLPGREEAVADR
jgi:signal transduction histidine kinase